MKKAYVSTIFILFAVWCSMGEENPGRQSVAVFPLNSAAAPLPAWVADSAVEHVKDAFLRIGRLDVIEGSRPFSDTEIAAIAQDPSEIRQFTEGESPAMERALAFVFPSVSFYQARQVNSGDHYVHLEIAFVLVIAGDTHESVKFTIVVAGLDPDRDKADMQALQDVPVQLVYEIRSIDALYGGGEVLHVDGRVVTIHYGRNNGVIRGDVFKLDNGERTGLMKVKTVDDELSYATLLYSGLTPIIGDRVVPARRIGFDTSVYVHGLIDLVARQRYDRDIRGMVTVGIRQGTTLGMYTFRPVIGVQAGFPDLAAIPFHVYAGADVRWYIRRVQITPMAGAGLGFVFQNADARALAYAGGLVQLNVSVLLGSRFRLFIEGGGEYWHGIGEYDMYGGVSFGGGIQVEY